ncbi:MAG: RecX family transcriptional regulator [Rubrivivax sp.]
MRRAAPLSLRAQALAWLAQREHSRQELRNKLLRRAQAQAQVQAQAHARAPTHAPAEAEARKAATCADEQADAELPARVDALLDALQVAGHLSDARFVDSRVHARQARFGNRRIEQELRSKGVQADDALRASLRETELERARAVWSARFGAPPADLREQARQARFLAARGFTAATIQRLLRHRDED